METLKALTKSTHVSTGARITGALRVMSPMAWVALGSAIGLLIAGNWVGWVELTTVGSTMVVLLCLAAFFTLGRTALDVTLELKPDRVTAGERAAASVMIRNSSERRMLPVRMEMSVGIGTAEFDVPSLAASDNHEELFVIPTVRRGVIPVGPATSVRSDPLGLLRRTQTWTDVVPLIVHPVTINLAQLGTGFIRDLEGRATNDMSDSDVAFHTLREYMPGDEQRHIHWLSTARTGSIMIRQFIETRRSHVGIALDGSKEAFRSDEEFETAVSVAASLGIRILLDDQQVTMVAGGGRIPTTNRNVFLDSLSLIESGGNRSNVPAAISGLLRIADGLSLAVVITGSTVGLDAIRRAAARFPGDVRVLVIRIDADTPTSFQPLGRQWLLSLAALNDLPHLLWAAVA